MVEKKVNLEEQEYLSKIAGNNEGYICSICKDKGYILVEIDKYEVNLMERKKKNSVIVFYNSIQANFKFKENGAYGKGALSYVIAKYGFCPDSCKYILAKYYNRFKIKLEIKHCY